MERMGNPSTEVTDAEPSRKFLVRQNFANRSRRWRLSSNHCYERPDIIRDLELYDFSLESMVAQHEIMLETYQIAYPDVHNLWHL